MPCGFSWVGYSQLDTRHCTVLLWIANNCNPLRREHFSSGFSGFDQTQNLILQKGPARANIGSLESWLDTCKSVMSNKIIIYKNNQNNLWEIMLYKCKIWICTVLFLQVCDGRTVSLALIILWCLTSSTDNLNSSHWLCSLWNMFRKTSCCGNFRPNTQGRGAELITMQGFQDRLCCESIGSQSSHKHYNCFLGKHTQCTRQERQAPESSGLVFISSAGLIILAMALSFSVLLVEKQHSVSGSVNSTLTGSIDCYVVRKFERQNIAPENQTPS